MDSAIPVTRTRILLPRRRGDLFSRQRLLNLLYELLDNKLTIVAAPAGYGKTSLLIDFANHIEYPVCWYAMDPLDRDPQRFLSYFISALNVRFPNFGNSSMSALGNAIAGEFNLDHLTTTIINDAYENISEHFVIVLDDYHLVDGSKQVDQFVSRFIQDVDENCHMMIASRTLLTLPDFPLMVARSQVGGLSFEELAFQSDELQALLLQNYQMTVSTEISNDLVRQTEGWITGLLLSTQAIQQKVPDRRRVAKVSGVGLNEYLEQVLLQQPEDIQKFLLRSSLLEEFDGSLCEEVIGRALELNGTHWDALVETVLHSNLFVLLVGEERIWLRYHHLFRDFLQARMGREFPEETRSIQQRLAEHFTRRGDWENAYRSYQQVGDLMSTAGLIEQAGTSMVAGGRVKVLSEWLDALPNELVDFRPALISIKASVIATQGNAHQSLQLYNRAIEMMKTGDQKDQLARALTRRALTHHMLGDYPSALEDAGEALALCEGQPELKPVAVEALRARGIGLYQLGNLNEALGWLERALDASQSLPERPNELVILTEIGLMYQLKGDYAAAERCYTQSLEHWRANVNSLWQANVLINLGFLKHQRGDYETAASNLEKALQHAKIVGVPRVEAFALTNIGDLYRDLQAIDEAREAYRRAYELAQKVGDRFLLVYLDLIEAAIERCKGNMDRARVRLRAAQERASSKGSRYEQSLCSLEDGAQKLADLSLKEAAAALQEAVENFDKDGYQQEAARARLYLAMVFHSMKNEAQAMDQLTRALSLTGEPEKQQPLVVAGWWEKDRIEAMRANKTLAPLVTSYLHQIDQFEDSLPKLRRRLREKASVVPFAPPKITIRALGKIQVKLNDRTVTSADWQTQAARDLFFILLNHQEGMTKEALGAIFWPDISQEELKLRFKNTIYRVRHAMGKQSIVLQDDDYRFNRNLDYEYDVEDFQKEIRLAQRASTPKEQIAHYQAAVRYYKGSYLPEIEENWILPERERLYLLFIDSLLKLSEINLEGGQFQAALDYSQRVLEQDPCLEAAHRLAMRIHAAMGNRVAVARQYERCRQALLEEIDALPSPQTQRLHETLMH